MAVNYDVTTKNARLDAVAARIDSGSGAGYIEIGTTSMGTVLATITLGDPCASSASGGVLTFSGFPRSDNSAAAGGTPAAAVVKASDGTVIVSGLTVGTASTDIVLDASTIAVGQKVTLNAATITHG
jgi:hypothetical protein